MLGLVKWLQLNMFAIKSEGLILIPKIHMVGKANQFLKVLSPSHSVMYTPFILKHMAWKETECSF